MMSMLQNVRMRRKMALLAGLLLATAAVAGVIQWRVSEANALTARANHQRYLSYRLADELRQSSDDLTRLARTYVVSADPKWEKQYMEVLDIRSGKAARPGGYDGIYWDFRAADVPVRGQPGETIALLDMMKREGFTKAEMDKLAEAAQRSGDLVKTEVVAMNLVKGLRPDASGNLVKGEPDLSRARELMHDAEYHRNKAKIMEPVNEFFQLLDARTRDAITQAQANASRLQAVFVGTLVVLLTVFFVLLNAVFRSITASLEHAVSLTGRIAEGDLTVEMPPHTGDEIGQLFDALGRMVDHLGGLVRKVRDGSQSLQSASAEIAHGNQDLSARTESQAAALEETNASMSSLSGTVRQNAEHAQQAHQLAEQASTVAREGGSVVAEVVETMKGISASSQRIADIINVIDGIAFQTNILALNAAVEAARAGDQGRGFAVVASEVRNLAQRSAESAKQIKSLITESVERVEQGNRLVDRAGGTMTGIVDGIARVSSIVSEISAASGEQSAGVSQVGEAVTQMDQMTQQNAALVEEMAAAADSLSHQAEDLVGAVSAFRLAEHH